MRRISTTIARWLAGIAMLAGSTGWHSAAAQGIGARDSALTNAVAEYLKDALKGERIAFSRQVYCGSSLECHDAWPQGWDSLTASHMIATLGGREASGTFDMIFAGADPPTIVINLGPFRSGPDDIRMVRARYARPYEIVIREFTIARSGSGWIVKRDRIIGGT